MARTYRLPGDLLLDVEQIVVWVVALVVLSTLTWSVVAVADDVRDTTPDAEFVVSFDEDTRTVTVGHTGGGAVTDRVTSRLSVVVVDASANATERFTWASDDTWYADRGAGFPVAEGDTFTFDDPSVDADSDGNYHDAPATVGFHLETGDRIRVVWEGVGRGGKPTTETLFAAELVPGSSGTVRAEIED